jgi:hypothetical protein
MEVLRLTCISDRFLVKGTQGQGRFYRPRGQCHNDMFPDIEPTTFEKYFQQRFAAK